MPVPGGAGGRPAPDNGGGGNGGNTGGTSKGGKGAGGRAGQTSGEAAREAFLASLLQQAAQPRWDPNDLLEAQNNLDSIYASLTSNNGPTDENGLPSNTNADNIAKNYVATQLEAGQAKTAEQLMQEQGVDSIAELPQVIHAQSQLDQAMRARRAAALKRETPEGSNKLISTKEIKDQTNRLSWDEYNALSPLQKAAIDYNTMLVKAVKRDRRMQDSYNPNEQQELNYDAAVEKMFPTGRSITNGLEYAPETVGLLQQIGYKGDREGDLNDFLNLDAAINRKDVKRMEKSEASGLRRGGLDFANPLVEERMNFKSNLVNLTQDAQSEALKKGNEILAKYQGLAFDQLRADSVAGMGGVPASMAGSLSVKQDQDFSQAFDLLADKNMDSGQVLYALQNEWDEEQRKQFVSYVQKRLVTSEQDGTPVTSTEGLDPRTATEMAQLLKLQGFGGGAK